MGPGGGDADPVEIHAGQGGVEECRLADPGGSLDDDDPALPMREGRDLSADAPQVSRTAYEVLRRRDVCVQPRPIPTVATGSHIGVVTPVTSLLKRSLARVPLPLQVR